MAIERYTDMEMSDLKDLIDSLGWFGASELTDSNQTLKVYADAEKTKQLIEILSSSNRFYFSHDGDMETSGHYFYGSFSNPGLKYAFKTRNGVLLTHTPGITGSTPWAAIIGKTNNGDIACAVTESTSEGPGVIHSGAYGESAVGLKGFSFRCGTNYPDNAEITSQVTGAPIPTCPSSGTSYIKGAMCLLSSPWRFYFGEAEISGARYATNGYLALNDAD